MDKNYEAGSAAGPTPLHDVRQSVYSDLQYVSLQMGGQIYGGWYRMLPDGRMELLALANMHCERRSEGTPIEQARGMLEDFIRAARTGERPDAAATTPAGGQRSESESLTLGKLLYADTAKPRTPENDWIQLVRLIAGRDQLALDQLFQRTHRVVYTLIMRLIGNPEIAEELTLDVYQGVWRQAAHVDLAGAGSVLAWLMNEARFRAIERLAIEREKKTGAHDLEQGAWLQNALRSLSADERQLIEAAYFSESTYQDLAAERQQPADDVKGQLQRSMEKLREQLLTGSP